MNNKSLISLGWLALIGSLAFAGWVSYDVFNRFRSLNSEDQVFSFGTGSIEQTEKRVVSMDPVINAHLFGTEPPPPKVEQPKIVEAPETKLNLTLTGIFSSKSPGNAFAMIEVKRGETSIVGVGQQIGKTQATIHSIEADHILIDHKGKIEKLQLERNGLGTPSTAGSEPATVKELQLTESEIAALTQIGNPDSENFSEEEFRNQLQKFELDGVDDEEEFEDEDEDEDEEEGGGQ